MIKSVELTESKFMTFRKLVSGIAFLLTCLCLGLLLCGFVPFWEKSLHVQAAVNGVFEIVNLGKKAFWYCAASITFSVLYIIATVKMIISIVSGFAGMKSWLISNCDNSESRQASRKVVRGASKSLWWILFLYVISYIIKGFSLTVGALLGIIGLIILNVLIHTAMNILFKGDVENSLIFAINGGIILSTMILFAFCSPNIQIITLMESIGSFFSVLTLSTGQVSGTVFLQIIVQQIMIPVFYLVMLFWVIKLNIDINNYGYVEKNSVKPLLICNIVFLCIILASIGFLNGFTEITQYLSLVYKNLIFVLATALVYVTAINTVSLPNDIKFFSDKKAETENKEDSENNVETENSAEPESSAKPENSESSIS